MCVLIILANYILGFMLKKILEDGKNKIEAKLPGNRKLYLLSGHEINCGFMLRLLDAFHPHVPPYGSHVIFELHKIEDVFGYKVIFIKAKLIFLIHLFLDFLSRLYLSQSKSFKS